MRTMSLPLCLCVALLLPWCALGQNRAPTLGHLDEDTQRNLLALKVLDHSSVLNSLLRLEHDVVLRQARVPRPGPQVPKRAQQGSRFALSLDVPTSILSVLIDLAKNQDMRTKAAANAELMARIGRRK
uniref:Corticotropin-releasing factor domain-containing protein n=1 Tax=Gouania willdenowi TaxID=441366 RepID=A0A8C5EBQ2_GOUWI